MPKPRHTICLTPTAEAYLLPLLLPLRFAVLQNQRQGLGSGGVNLLLSFPTPKRLKEDILAYRFVALLR